MDNIMHCTAAPVAFVVDLSKFIFLELFLRLTDYLFNQVWGHFSWSDSTGTIRLLCSRGISRPRNLYHTYVHIFLPPPSCPGGMLHWNVVHPFIPTFCMQLVQFKDINQVMDYLLAIITIISNFKPYFSFSPSNLNAE